jgi:hypothetical protein
VIATNCVVESEEGKKSPLGWRFALALTLSLRVIYSFVAVVYRLTQVPPLDRIRGNALTDTLAPPDHSAQYLLLGAWQRFDTLWYLHVAMHGYRHPASVVFFPLYPMLIRALSFLVSPTAAALVISTFAAFCLFLGLPELWLAERGPRLAEQSILICALWPGSFVFFAGYAESLVFALIVWTLVEAQKNRWMLGSILGVAAALTKAIGVIVLVPLLIIACRQRRISALATMMIPLGPFGYWEYLHRSGHIGIGAAYVTYWRTVAAPPWVTVWRAVSPHSLRMPNGELLFTFSFLVAVVVLSIVSRERVEYKSYAAGAITVSLCKETVFPLQSMVRYLLIVFPAYSGLARLVQTPWLQKRFVMVCSLLFAMNLTLLWLFFDWWLVV